MNASDLFKAGKLQQAVDAQLKEVKAHAEAPAVSGTLNGKAFADLRDLDELFGTVLEVLANGRYFWVPLEQVATVAAKAPQVPRDLLWLPARLDLFDGATGEVFLPA